MARALILLSALLLAACNENPNAQACSQMSLKGLSAEQLRAVQTLCTEAKPASLPVVKKAAPPKTLAGEMRTGAAEMGMPVDQFIATPVGRYIMAKYYAPYVMGPLMIFAIWLTFGWMLRYSARTPSKIEERKTWLGKRLVVTEYACKPLDGWFVSFMVAICAGYSAAVYFGVMT